MFNARFAPISFVGMLVLAALPAGAQAPPPSGGAAANLQDRVAVLEASVATLQTTVGTLQTAVTNLQSSVASEAATRAAADTSLQGQLAKLQGNITAADLVGTYAMVVLAVPLQGFVQGVQQAYVQTDGITGTLTLAANGNATLVQGGCSIRLQVGVLSNQCGSENTNGTWSYASGLLTLNLGPFSFVANVGAGGRVLTTAEASFHASSTSSDTLIVIGTRLQ